MVLARYLVKKYVTYWFGVAIFFGLLCNIIEFFEKMVRVSDVSFRHLFYFFGLQIIPSIADFFPLASWLATALLLFELQQRNGWLLLSLVMMKKRVIIYILCSCGIALGCMSILLYEYVALPSSYHAERLRREVFKKIDVRLLYDYRILLPNQVVCTFGVCDPARKCARNVTVVFLDAAHRPLRMYQAHELRWDDTLAVELDNGFCYNIEQDTTLFFDHQVLYLPYVANHIRHDYQRKSWAALTLDLKLGRTRMSSEAYRQELFEWIDRSLCYLRIILLPVATGSASFLVAQSLPLRWMFIVLVYPMSGLVSFIIRLLI